MLEPTTITTSTAAVWLGPDGIIRAAVRRDGYQTLETARENIAAFRILNAPEHWRPVMIDCRDLNSGMDREARQYYASGYEEGQVTAVALLLGSAASRIVSSFLLGSTGRGGDLRVFSDEAEALGWLRGYVR